MGLRQFFPWKTVFICFWEHLPLRISLHVGNQHKIHNFWILYSIWPILNSEKFYSQKNNSNKITFWNFLEIFSKIKSAASHANTNSRHSNLVICCYVNNLMLFSNVVSLGSWCSIVQTVAVTFSLGWRFPDVVVACHAYDIFCHCYCCRPMLLVQSHIFIFCFHLLPFYYWLPMVAVVVIIWLVLLVNLLLSLQIFYRLFLFLSEFICIICWVSVIIAYLLSFIFLFSILSCFQGPPLFRLCAAWIPCCRSSSPSHKCTLSSWMQG